MALSRTIFSYVKSRCRSPLTAVPSFAGNMRLKSNFPKPRSKDLMKVTLFGVGIGAVIGIGYSYIEYIDSQKPIVFTKEIVPLVQEFPDVVASQTIVNPYYTSDIRLSLFQYAGCPFCCKVRAFLDYYGISYEVIEVNPFLKQDLYWAYFKKVPIMIAHYDGKYSQMFDSSMIISALMSHFMEKESNLNDTLKFYPIVKFKENGVEKIEFVNKYYLVSQKQKISEEQKDAVISESKWRKWVDESLVHTLTPNVYRTPKEALATFHWFSETGQWNKTFSAWERIPIIYLGSFVMWLVGKISKRRHHLKSDVRESFYDECNEWLQTIQKQGTSFMGGNTPNLADVEVYGVLSSIEGSKAFDDVMKNTNLGAWYREMQVRVRHSRGRVFLSKLKDHN